MDNEKEPVVPVPAGVLAALEAMCILGDSCKTINYKGVLDTISSRAEEVEEGLSGTISALSLSYMMFEIEKTPRGRSGEKVDERNPWEIPRQEERSSCTICR